MGTGGHPLVRVEGRKLGPRRRESALPPTGLVVGVAALRSAARGEHILAGLNAPESTLEGEPPALMNAEFPLEQRPPRICKRPSKAERPSWRNLEFMVRPNGTAESQSEND
jgi:hypothetical protein